MKKKLFSILALVLVAMSASAVEGYTLSVGTSEHGTIAFKVGTNENAEYANEGDVVTVTITPATGYVVNQPSGQWIAAVAAARSNAPANIDLLKDVELTAAGTNTWTFTMQRANVEISATYKKLLTNTDITVQDIAAVTYNGQAQEPTVTVKDGTTTLVLNTDYTVIYSNNTNAALSTAATAPTVTITGAGNYSGTVTKTFTIQKANITSLTAPTTEELTYNGGDQALVIAGQVEGGTVVYSLDGQTYSADIPKGKDAGAYMVFYKVEPDANHDTNLAAQFILQTIFKAPLSSVALESTELVYNQQEQTPSISSVKAGTLDVPAADYTIVGLGTNVGTYMLTVTAKNSAKNFTGSASAQYSIVAADASTKFTLTVDPESVVYNSQYQTPGVTVQDGSAVLTEGTDYTLTYSNNLNTGTATVTVTGSGNYTGSVSKTFTIAMAKLTLDEETANGEALDGADGKWYDVTLKRTLQAGMWNTFAVPFAVDAATLTAMGLTAKALTGSSFDGQTLTLHFADATAIEAGKPYLVKAAETVTDPVFGKVQVSKTAVPAVTAAADFVPTLGKTEMKADDAKSVLFLTSGNKLQYPASLPADFKGFRAYFQLKGAAATARSFELDIDGETTAISAVSGSPADNGAVYTLDGRKVTNPAKKGVYIVNGKKVIIK